jgi:hypothetical protein
MHDFSIHARWRSMAAASSESKPTMKPSRHVEPATNQFVHRLVQVDGEILRLVGFAQGLGRRGLDAHEHGVEARAHHRLHQFIRGGQVDAGLGIELEREAVLLHPLLQDGHKAQGLHLVAHQVVVGKKHGSAKAGGQQGIELAA